MRASSWLLVQPWSGPGDTAPYAQSPCTGLLPYETNPILVLAQMSSNVKHPANPYQSCMRDTHSFHYLLHILHIHNKSWNGGAKDLRATSFPELRTTQDSVFEFQAVVAWQVWSRVVAQPEVITDRKKCAAKQHVLPRSSKQIKRQMYN